MVTCTLNQVNSNSVLSVKGELTDMAISVLERELDEWLETRHAGLELILDLSECAYIDSRVSQRLVEARTGVPKECTIILIPGENWGVKNVVELLHLDQYFTIPKVVAIR